MHPEKATMRDVARLAGVSQSTVSLVLNQADHGSIPPETRQKVLEAAKELHYDKPARTRSKGQPKSGAILVLAGSMTNPYYPYMLQGLERAAAGEHLHLLACCTHHRAEEERAFLELAVRQRHLAAIYLYPPEDEAFAQQMNLRLPVLAICDKRKGSRLDLIELNNYQAGVLAAEHVIGLGHRRIAVLAAEPDRNLARINRIKGITACAAAHGLEDQLTVLTRLPDGGELDGGTLGEGDDYRAGYRLARYPERYFPGCTALIAINDMQAIGALDGLLYSGRNVPEEISVVGFDNLLFAGVSRISLTSVDHHPDVLAQAAMDLLRHRITPESRGHWLSAARFQVDCAPRLVMRNSTARLNVK